MKFFGVIVAAAALAGFATPAMAAVTISFAPTNQPLGTTQSYTIDGKTVVASGFDQNGDATDLYQKNQGVGEIGLGLANDPTGQNEISYDHGFIQLDVSELLNFVSDISFGTNSVTLGEQWTVYGSNTSGQLGVALDSGTTNGIFSLLGLGNYNYYDFVSTSSANTGNYLLSSLSITPAVPEPATWALMLLGFGLLGLGLRRSDRPQLAFRAA